MGTLRHLAVWNAGAMDMVDFLNASFGDIFQFYFLINALTDWKTIAVSWPYSSHHGTTIAIPRHSATVSP